VHDRKLAPRARTLNAVQLGPHPAPVLQALWQ
jgi:hypothetical protein